MEKMTPEQLEEAKLRVVDTLEEIKNAIKRLDTDIKALLKPIPKKKPEPSVLGTGYIGRRPV